jgi:hypothetical protein
VRVCVCACVRGCVCMCAWCNMCACVGGQLDNLFGGITGFFAGICEPQPCFPREEHQYTQEASNVPPRVDDEAHPLKSTYSNALFFVNAVGTDLREVLPAL